MSDPNVLVINERRMMNDVGWNVSDPRFLNYTTDGVHATAIGAQMLASADFSAMSSLPEPATLAAFGFGALTLLRRSKR